MNILITGATGFIGKHLVSYLASLNHNITIISRSSHPVNPLATHSFSWNYEREDFPVPALENIDVVIHLLGETIAALRWSKKKLHKIRSSRVDSTKALVKAMAKMNLPPKTFISASAVGIYGNRGDEILDEQSSLGNDFLADVGKNWEQASLGLTEMGTRRIILRFGIVFSEDGGFLKQLITLTKFGLTSPVGTGNQWVSWIHIYDLLSLINACMMDVDFSGVCNAVAPRPLTNVTLMRELASAYSRPFMPRVPAWLLKLIMGQASSLALNSQRVIATRLPYGFKFEKPEFHLHKAK